MPNSSRSGPSCASAPIMTTCTGTRQSLSQRRQGSLAKPPSLSNRIAAHPWVSISCCRLSNSAQENPWPSGVNRGASVEACHSPGICGRLPSSQRKRANGGAGSASAILSNRKPSRYSAVSILPISIMLPLVSSTTQTLCLFIECPYPVRIQRASDRKDSTRPFHRDPGRHRALGELRPALEHVASRYPETTTRWRPHH
ncbi:hypothetical protein D3C84_864000 [compost metagenome]